MEAQMVTTITPAVTMTGKAIAFLQTMEDGASERHSIEDLVCDAASGENTDYGKVREIGKFLAMVALACFGECGYSEGFSEAKTNRD
jgi:hypothetical protein